MADAAALHLYRRIVSSEDEFSSMERACSIHPPVSVWYRRAVCSMPAILLGRSSETTAALHERKGFGGRADSAVVRRIAAMRAAR